MVAAEAGVVVLQGPVEGAGRGNPSEVEGLEQMMEQMLTMICDSENPCEYWTFSNLPQIPQMLYYLNLKNKKIYKKVILRENSKNICGICCNP